MVTIIVALLSKLYDAECDLEKKSLYTLFPKTTFYSNQNSETPPSVDIKALRVFKPEKMSILEHQL